MKRLHLWVNPTQILTIQFHVAVQQAQSGNRDWLPDHYDTISDGVNFPQLLGMASVPQQEPTTRESVLAHRPRDEQGLWSWPGKQQTESPESTRRRRVHFGHDHVFDAKSSTTSSARSGTSTSPITPTINPTGFFPKAVPTFTTGLTTFAYERALQNRILDEKLQLGGDFDVQIFTPTFIHDCLMLPGSLANLLHNVQRPIYPCESLQLIQRQIDNLELILRTTPALLPGFHAHVHSDTLQPCILQSSAPSDYVHGMLILGLGRESRDLINAHYRADNCRRIKVQVDIDVVVPIPDPEQRHFRAERWRLKRRKVEAHAWLWTEKVGSVDVQFRPQAPARGWTVEAFLGGELEVAAAPHVVEHWGDAKVEVVDLVQNQPQSRETVYGGSGPLDYERGQGFTGW